MDPWGQVEDIHGDALYRALQIEHTAKDADIKKAYRQLAKQHHPDKGGDARRFSIIQHAYEVLIDHKRRLVYDTWARELQFRHVRPANNHPLGGEDILLNELDAMGLHCDPGSQLVVTCEVCRRPATKECWTCGMQICEFCTLKRHWKDGVPLHWPLINSDHMKERLAKKELEKKRIDDANRLALQNPHHRSDKELTDIRSFRQTACEILQREDRHTLYDLRLAKFYMWAQTDSSIFIACRVPTGFADKELIIDCTERGLLLQPEDSPPIIDRFFSYGIDTSAAIETIKTEDNRVCVVQLHKAQPGLHWLRLFRGDPDGARCLQPPYAITETTDDVILELTLPFWIESDDVRVDITETDVAISVRGSYSIRMTYWRNKEEEQRRGGDYHVVDVDECTWCLDDDVDRDGEKIKVLMVTLARPQLTDDEVTWKKSRRQDNRAATRPGSMTQHGYRFFTDDEDYFDVEDVLQAMCFNEAGKAYVPPKPWNQSEEPRWVTEAGWLSAAALSLIKQLQGLSQNK